MPRRAKSSRSFSSARVTRMRAAYGDVLQLPIPDPPTYLVTDPEAVRRVLVTNARGYGKRTLQYTTLSLVTGDGLLTADTDTWRPARRLVQPAFHRDTLANRWLWIALGGVVLLQVGVTHVGFLQRLFDTTSISVLQWLVCIAVASSVVVIEEIRKFIARKGLA